MKKVLFFIGVCFLFLGTTSVFNSAEAATLGEKLKGRILLQVESHGEAWYIDTVSGERYYMGRPSDAFNLMRKLGLGISNSDFARMQNYAPLKLAGKILLKVQDKGQAYYVNPTDLKLYYLGRPNDAFEIMRKLGLGITNSNLNIIKISAQSASAITPSGNTNTNTNTSNSTSQNTSNGLEPYITSIKVANGSDTGYIDAGDTITITFNEEIDPLSIRSDLKKGGSINDVYYYKTGGVNISSNGLVTIANIASFDMGTIEGNTFFTVKAALDYSGKVLTITLVTENDIAIVSENFSGASQVSGTVKDVNGNAMLNQSISNLSGSFGGAYGDDSGTPYITAIKIIDDGDTGYIDNNDAILITFNEAVNPDSIDSDLENGGTVSGVPYNSTGGISISSSGKVTIKNIATFYMGTVKNSGTFNAELSLNSTGKILTITLTSGSDIAITDEEFSNTNQTGGTIKDLDGKTMVTDTDISNPTGTFGGVDSDTDTENPYITSISVSNNGDEGYIDTSDYITINFSEAIDPESISDDLETGSYISGIPYGSTGGVTVSSSGKVTIKNIASFFMGTVANSGTFDVKIALNSTGKVLTITLTSGDDVEITDEDLTDATQISGTIKDLEDNVMANDTDSYNLSGTFGGAYNDTSDTPYVTAVQVTNNGDNWFIDTSDKIAITFNEEIDPHSINSDLEKGSYVSGVSYSSTGGISVTSAGKITIRNIGSFYMGSVVNSGNFNVKLALNSTGKILTITLTSGSNVEITSEDFGSFSQTGGTVMDIDENEMVGNTEVCTPTGTFGS